MSRQHHYVPQLYLRNWATDSNKRQIGTFCLQANKLVLSASIRHQAQKPNFYGDAELEAAFSKCESRWAEMIRRIETTQSLPPFHSEEMSELLVFVAIQAFRTPQAVSDLDELIAGKIDVLKEMGVHPDVLGTLRNDGRGAKYALQFAAEVLPVMQDLEAKLVIAPAQMPYITSDHPVLLYNQFLERRRTFGGTTGWGCAGLEVFLPISPKIMLVLFDPNAYRIGGKRLARVRVTANAEDVQTLNILQVANASSQIYFNSVPTKMVWNWVRAAAKWRMGDRVRVQVLNHIDPANTNQLIATHRVPLNTGLKLSFASEYPSASLYFESLGNAKVRPYAELILHEAWERLQKSGPVRLDLRSPPSNSKS